MDTLRVLVSAPAVLRLLIGVIWVLQGVNFAPGSFMTGQITWVIHGAPLALAGAAGVAVTAGYIGVIAFGKNLLEGVGYILGGTIAHRLGARLHAQQQPAHVRMVDDGHRLGATGHIAALHPLARIGERLLEGAL